ncbi:hypothetical protein GF371_01100 [Candidatus Woesearchaeota archaeon]|nr:hypothetical protein [Candidatus Woesearchaeota archaeon]
MVELFGGKKEAKGIPTDRIIQMQQQGYSNDQIVSVLQREGYKSSEIFEAISHAEVKKGVTGAPAANITEPESPMEMKPKSVAQPKQMQGITPPPISKPSISTEKIEQIAEAIIEEKWEEVTENINKVIEWKDRTESKLSDLNTKFEQAKTSVQGIKDEFMEKLGEYDKKLTEISTDVQAMSRVFEKILPQFMESVGELSRIASGTKAGRKIAETAAKMESELKKPRKAAETTGKAKPRSTKKPKSRTEEIFGMRGEGPEEDKEEKTETKSKTKKKSIEDIQ